MSRRRGQVLTFVLAWFAGCLAAPSSYGQDADTTPPEVIGFNFEPRSIDVTSSPLAVTMTLQLSDDLSGAQGGYIAFESPTGIQDFTGFAFDRTAGNPLNGTYQGVISFPQFIQAGTWTVRSVQVVDAVGNWGFLGTDVLAAKNFPTTLDVVSIEDVEAPTLVDIVVTATALDVSAGDATTTIELHVTDNRSGVDLPGSGVTFIVVMESPSGNQSQYLASSQFALVSGTINDGTWRATARFPRYSEPGEWRIMQVYLSDLAGNWRRWFRGDLVGADLDTGTDIQVASDPADTTPPSLVRIQLIPTVIDTAASAQTIRVRMTITDDLAGVDFSPDTPSLTFLYGVRFTSPSAGQFFWSAGIFGFGLERVAGDQLGGIWEENVIIPRFSEAGTWRVEYVQLKDSAHNVLFLTQDDLDGTGIVDDLVVIRPSLVSDGTIGIGGGVVTDDTFGERASVTIPPGAVARPTSVAIDVFESPLDVPMPQGFAAPGTRFVNIDLNPEPAFPLPAPGLTVVLPLVDVAIPGTPLTLFRIEPSTGQLVPSLDASGSPIIGTVNSNGLSATFTGVVRLSTVVGLVASTPDSAAPTIVCAPADTLWHAANVTLACTAHDEGSGLATQSDASFGLSTSVAAGQEQSNASTNTRQVCDVAGNCATAGPIGGNMIDRKAPLLTPPPNQTAVQTQPGGTVVNYSPATVVETGSGLASSTCLPASGSVFAVGTTTVACTAVDVVGNTNTATFIITVTPAPDGRIHGAGHIGNGKIHHHFVFRVAQSNEREYGRLEYWVSESRFCSRDDHGHEYDAGRNGLDEREYGRRHGKPSGHFQVSAITSVVFSNDPGFEPNRAGRANRPNVDSVLFTGTGKWNGKSGFSFQATATDQGEPGRRRDTFLLVVRDAAGNIVVNLAGILDAGNIQSTRLKR
jgi:hypothetical protein